MRWQEEYPDPLTAVFEEARRRRDVPVFVVAAAAFALPMVGGIVLDHFGVAGHGGALGTWTGIGGTSAAVALALTFLWAYARMGFGALPVGAWMMMIVGAAMLLGPAIEAFAPDNQLAASVGRWVVAAALTCVLLRVIPWGWAAVVTDPRYGLAVRAMTVMWLGGLVAMEVAILAFIVMSTALPVWAWWLMGTGAVVGVVGGLGLRLLYRHHPDWQAPREPDWWEGLPSELAEQVKSRRQRSDRVVLVGGVLFIVVGLGGFAAGYLLELAAAVGLIALAVGCAAGLAGMIYAVVLHEQARAIVAKHESESEDPGEQNHSDTR